MIKRLLFDGMNFAVLGCIALAAALRPDEEQLLLLSRNASIFFGFAVAGSFLSWLLNQKDFKTLGEKLFEPPHKKALEHPVSLWRTLWGWQLVVSFLGLLLVSISLTHASLLQLIDEDGFHAAVNLFRGLLSPNWTLLPVAVAKVIETIFIAFLATVIAVPLAFFLAFLTAKNIMTHPAAFSVYAALRTLFNFMRSIEPVIWAIIFSTWVGIGPFAGMLALMIHSVASLTKQYSEIVESVSDGPIEGVQSTGANLVQTIWFAIVPQVVLPYISFTIYRWDINVRMATIIGFAGGGGIGTILNQYSLRAMWPEVGCLVLVIAAVVWLMDLTSAYVREALK